MVDSKLLLEATGSVTLFVYGAKKDPGGWIIFEHNGDLEVYDSYFKFSANRISKSPSGKNDGYINHTGIVPFEGIIPVKQYMGQLIKKDKRLKHTKKIEFFTHADRMDTRYFACQFECKYGWQKIPRFMDSYSGPMTTELNKHLLKSQEEYEKTLKASFLGPYISLSLGFVKKEDSKDFLDEVLDIFKSLDIENPPSKIEGSIKVNFKAFS